MKYIEEINAIWEQVKESFVEHDNMAPSTAELWFGELKIQNFSEDKIVFCTHSSYKYEILIAKYVPVIEKGFERLMGFPVKVSIELHNNRDNDKEAVKNIIATDSQNEVEKKENKTEEKEATPDKIGSTMPTVNFEYTFENFIEGNSNTFVRAACWAVAQNASDASDGYTASQYNPLFIYGPSGIGKTHLMYAISNKVKKENPNAQIIYIKSEDFTNQLINSLSKQSMPEFREKYRQCDILMIDDIQFIAGKNATQEEFFHTFNALYESEKQIIVTSDRPPREIKTLEDRIKSRLEMGLIADIQPPDLELRIAIIKKKAEQGKIIIPDEVLTFLAENLRSNIRQIEGAIKKLSALSFLSGKKITIDLAKNLLSELLGGAEPVSVTVEKIFTSIYKHYNFKKEDLVGKIRTKELANTRHIAIYLIRQVTEMSLPNIGKIFNRDHTTIMASIDTVEKKLITDNNLNMEINEIIKEVTEGALV